MIASPFVRLYLPPLLLLPFVPFPKTPSLRPPSAHLEPPISHSETSPATSHTVLVTLAHLHVINDLLPASLLGPVQLRWIESWRSMDSKRLVRGGLVLWVFWVLLNMLLGGRAVSRTLERLMVSYSDRNI